MIARWPRWERAQVIRHWRGDMRRGFAVGLAIGGPLLAWLGLD